MGGGATATGVKSTQHAANWGSSVAAKLVQEGKKICLCKNALAHISGYGYLVDPEWRDNQQAV